MKDKFIAFPRGKSGYLFIREDEIAAVDVCTEAVGDNFIRVYLKSGNTIYAAPPEKIGDPHTLSSILAYVSTRPWEEGI